MGPSNQGQPPPGPGNREKLQGKRIERLGVVTAIVGVFVFLVMQELTHDVRIAFWAMVIVSVIVAAVGAAIQTAGKAAGAGVRELSRQIARGKEEGRLEAEKAQADNEPLRRAQVEVKELRSRLSELERKMEGYDEAPEDK